MPTLQQIPTFQQGKVISLFKVTAYIAAILAGLWLIWMMRGLIPPLLIAATIAVALAPEIDAMERRFKLPRWACVFLLYAVFVGLVIFSMTVITQNIGGQIKDLGSFISANSATALAKIQTAHAGAPSRLFGIHLPVAVQARINGLINEVPNRITAYLSNALLAFSAQLPEFAGNLLNFIIVPIIAFYLLVDYHKIVGKMLLFVRPDRREGVLVSMADVVAVFGQYVRGVVIMVVIDILVTYSVLLIMHVRFAETVALIAGVLYAVPYLGAMVSTVLIFLMAWLGLGLCKAVVVLVIMIVIHQLIFDQVVAPRVIGKQVDLHPLLAFLAMLVGGTLFGVAGTLLAVPIAAAARIILIRLYPRLQEEYTGVTIIASEEAKQAKRRSRKLPDKSIPKPTIEPPSEDQRKDEPTISTALE